MSSHVPLALLSSCTARSSRDISFSCSDRRMMDAKKRSASKDLMVGGFGPGKKTDSRIWPGISFSSQTEGYYVLDGSWAGWRNEVQFVSEANVKRELVAASRQEISSASSGGCRYFDVPQCHFKQQEAERSHVGVHFARQLRRKGKYVRFQVQQSILHSSQPGQKSLFASPIRVARNRHSRDNLSNDEQHELSSSNAHLQTFCSTITLPECKWP
jgi:hypothetical protein